MINTQGILENGFFTNVKRQLPILSKRPRQEEKREEKEMPLISSFFEQKKKPKKVAHTEAVTWSLKRQMWELHAGFHKKAISCFGCGHKTLELNTKAGWEASHVVARVWFQKNVTTCGALTKYDLVPLCRACNLNMGDKCMWEWMYERGRVRQLKQLCYNIYRVYAEEHPQEMMQCHSMCWRLIVQHLHGTDRFPDGKGTISKTNKQPIIDILKLHQQELLEEEMKQLVQTLGEKRKLIQRLLENR